MRGKNLGLHMPQAKSRWPVFIMTAVLASAIRVCAQQLYQDGVRAGGMGDAYVAISDDVAGVRFNPSGLIYSPQELHFEFSTQNLFSSGLPFQSDLKNEGRINLYSIGGVRNWVERPNRTRPVFARADNGVNGAAHSGKVYPPSPTATTLSAGGLINFLDTGLLNHLEIRGYLAKAFMRKTEVNTLDRSHLHHPHWFAVSITGKILGYQYPEADEIANRAEVNTEAEREAVRNFFNSNGNSSVRAGVDFGASMHVFRNLRLGAVLTDFLRPNVGLQSASKYPRRLRGGIAFVAMPAWHWLMAADVEKRERDDNIKWYLGTESRLTALGLDNFKLRFGANPNWFSTGFSVQVYPVAVNYAFLYFRHYDSFYNHRLSLSLVK